MLTAADDTVVTVAAFLAGAAGVVSKSITSSELVAAVRTVAAGNSLLDSRAAATILNQLRNPNPVEGPFEGLTAVEHRVLDCIGEGMTNREIGEALFIAEKTVKNYVSRVLTKLGVTSRTLAALAVSKENASEGGH
jgi:DNA-binding NarL/FixJ family response regulator